MKKVALTIVGMLIAVAPFAWPAAANAADCSGAVPAASTCPPPTGTQSLPAGFVVAPSVAATTAHVVTPAAAPVAAPAEAPQSGTLPFTGGDVAGLAVIGFVLLGAGTVIVRRTRVRPAESKA